MKHHHQLIQQRQSGGGGSYVVVTKPRSSSSSTSLQQVLIFFLILTLIMFYIVTSQVLLDDDNNNSESSYSLSPKFDRLRKRNFESNDQGETSCFHLLEKEKLSKSTLVDQVHRLEMELTENRAKQREIEADYRDLALSSRQQQQAIAKPVATTTDVSALQRLSVCRTSLEESTQIVKELREKNRNLEEQVTRLQKELREAILDADEQERIATDCQKKRKS